MAKLKAEIKNINRLLYRFDKIAKMDLTNKVNQITTLAHGQAKALCPVDKGNLRESIHMQVKKTDRAIQGRVYTNVEYAPYVEFGTGVTGNGTYPYKIKGLNLTYKDKGWAYFDEDKNEWIYTKGQVAQPYMYPAIRRNRKAMKKIMAEGIVSSLKNVFKGGK